MTDKHANEPIDLVLDTDIGTDVDDVLALATILGSPELALGAVTTVYGDVLLRARMASRVARVARRQVGPIVPGLDLTRSGRPVWWPGHEGALMDGLEGEAVDSSSDAVSILAESATTLAIGPLTNLAAAMERSTADSHELYLMGGEFADGRVEHNIRCDVAAADVVFGSGRHMTVIGLDQTRRVRVSADVVEQIERAGELGLLLAAEIRQFWQFTDQPSNVPHDALAALMIARPDLFDFETGTVRVVAAGDREGVTEFTRTTDGPHRIVVDFDFEEAATQIVERILSACAQSVLATTKEN